MRPLLDKNPELEIRNGGRHLKLIFRGRLVGIYPYHARSEGVSQNLLAQLRRNGVKTR